MAEPLSSRMPLRASRVSSSAADFLRRLGTIEDELRRLPQNLCVLLTQTPLTEHGARYSLLECGDKERLGTHWRFAGGFVEWGHLPNFDQATDRFPFGVVLSRTASLLDLAVDADDRTWLNFGGKCGFYVAGNTVRDSLPEGPVAYELTERTIWHYFAENTGETIPEESLFASVNEQLLHCYRGSRETCMQFIDQLSLDDETTGIVAELEWPEVMLYLGLKYPGPFFSVERCSVERSLPGEPREPLIPWGNSEECHHVFRIRPASVARATLYALEALSRMVQAVDEPGGGAPPTIEAAAALPVPQSPDGTAAELDGGTSTPAKRKQSTERGEATTNDQPLSRLLSVFTNGLAEVRIQQASTVVQDDKLTTNEKLKKIDGLIQFPATTSAEQLGQLLGVTKQAVLKTEWWIQNRRGEKANEIGRRRNVHNQRAAQLQKDRPNDEDD